MSRLIYTGPTDKESHSLSLTQYACGEGKLCLQLTGENCDRGLGYVSINRNEALDLIKELSEWAGLRPKKDREIEKALMNQAADKILELISKVKELQERAEATEEQLTELREIIPELAERTKAAEAEVKRLREDELILLQQASDRENWKADAEAAEAQLTEKDRRIEELEGRLVKIGDIIFGIEQRCMAMDGPVGHTVDEIIEEEIQEIYKLAVPRQALAEKGAEE
jgi:predicted RNase H-like nuclease (RuvC/YqgF family)